MSERDVVLLAEFNDPDLAALRDGLGLARAQAFAAGLLPDPSFALSDEFPGAVGFVPGFMRGVAFDFASLITLSARRSSADALVVQRVFDLQWAEWQVASRARQLFADVIGLNDVDRQLRELLALERSRFEQGEQAVREGDLAMEFLMRWSDELRSGAREVAAVDKQRVTARSDLNYLLGRPAGAPLRLASAKGLPTAPLPDVKDAIAQLPTRRPDLLALAAGYRAQEEKFRAAVLGQFPALHIGTNRSRDTSGVYSTGFSLSLDLPLFNRNRGNIAIEHASRQQLYDEYRQRIAQATSAAEKLVQQRVVVDQQLSRARQTQATIRGLLAGAEKGYRSGDIGIDAFTALRTSALAQSVEIANLELAMFVQNADLRTVLGIPPVGVQGGGKQE